MKGKLTQEQVRHVAKLARLKCTNGEIERFTGQLGAILEYVEQLAEVDTTEVEPLAHCLPVANVLREDEPTGGLTCDEALANAPQRDDDFFAVPRILGDSSA
jgi:aspartyl-tRNA(Asn)/glutamyl-tRNA(Gln) amidotransferase subunit C